LLQREDLADRLVRGRVSRRRHGSGADGALDGLPGTPIRISVGGARRAGANSEISGEADTALSADAPTAADAMMLLYFTSGTSG